MDRLRAVLRITYLRFQLVVMNGLALAALASGARPAALALLLGSAVATSFLVERLLPYNAEWNRSQGDAKRDVIHAVVNESLNLLSVGMIPILASLGVGLRVWPHDWPFLVADAGGARCARLRCELRSLR